MLFGDESDLAEVQRGIRAARLPEYVRPTSVRIVPGPDREPLAVVRFSVDPKRGARLLKDFDVTEKVRNRVIDTIRAKAGVEWAVVDFDPATQTAKTTTTRRRKATR